MRVEISYIKKYKIKLKINFAHKNKLILSLFVISKKDLNMKEKNLDILLIYR